MRLSQPQQAEMRTDALVEKLRVVIGLLPPGEVALAEVRDILGQDGLLLLIVLLTIVFRVPISIPGVSTVFGTVILLISISRLFGRSLWFPKSIAQYGLPADKLRSGLNHGRIWLRRLERISRPHRLNGLASTGTMGVLNNCALITGAILLMAPFGLIPLSNTLPALALLFITIGLLQRDGLCILFGHLANCITIIYFNALIVGGGVAMHEAFRHVVSAKS